MGERRRRYTREFKVEAVRLAHESGKPQAQVAPGTRHSGGHAA